MLLGQRAGGCPSGCPPAGLHSSRRATLPGTRLLPTRRAVTVHGLKSPTPLENYELLIGDCVGLTAFATWKQLSAIVLSPTFPGWLAPLSFNPLRFIEFASFVLTLCGSWVAASLLVGNYRTASTSDLPTTLAATSRAWLASMPVAAAQLVLMTALENRELVGSEGFAAALPLAASGPGEPFVTAAGVLGVMAMWRSFYCCFLDYWNFKSIKSNLRSNKPSDAYRFQEALFMVGIMATLSLAVILTLQLVVDQDLLLAAVPASQHSTGAAEGLWLPWEAVQP